MSLESQFRALREGARNVSKLNVMADMRILFKQVAY